MNSEPIYYQTHTHCTQAGWAFHLYNYEIVMLDMYVLYSDILWSPVILGTGIWIIGHTNAKKMDIKLTTLSASCIPV